MNDARNPPSPETASPPTAGGLTVNDRVMLHPVAEAVWGAYDLDTGHARFLDELSIRILELAPAFDTPDELARAVVAVLAQKDSQVADGVPSRVAELVAFGALLEAPRRERARVLLVDPPCPPKMMGDPGPAKGLTYLSQSLVQAGQPAARILDMRSVADRLGSRPEQLEYLAHWTGRRADLDPRVVGITAVSATIGDALFMARAAKLLFPGVQVVLGGPHASYEWQGLLADHPEVDYVVRGEGEIPFPSLVERLLATDSGGTEDPPPPVDDLPGLAWRSADGTPTTSGWCHGLADLDAFPFPDDRRDLINGEDYEIEHPRILTGRGCPFKCSFCSTATFTGRRLRQRSVESVMEELRFYWQKYDARTFTFDDDIFTVNKKRARALCEAIRDSEMGGDIRWGCNTRMDCIDEPLIELMAEAGCRFILFGIESGDPDVQKRFGKGKRSLEGFRVKLERMVELGIEPQLNFILGLPREDRSTLRKILPLVEGQPQIPCAFNFLTLFPGTPLVEQADELGLRWLGTSDEERYSLTAPTLETDTLSARDQVEAYLEMKWIRRRDLAAWQRQQGAGQPTAAGLPPA